MSRFPFWRSAWRAGALALGLAICGGVGLALSTPGGASACGAQSDCTLRGADGSALGAYRIYRPDGVAPERPAGAVIFLHGWRATAAAMLSNKSLRALGDRLGALVVAPQGAGKTWSYPGSPTQLRDEFVFFAALRAELIARWNADPERLLLSGFSMGGSMVWNVACRMGDAYAVFAPMAGAFWEPLPTRCPNPARRVWHLHGVSDTVVPIAGRPIGDRWRQGDAWESFARLRASGARGGAWTRADSVDASGRECARWRLEARAYVFCRHKGGHLWRAGWIERAWREAGLDDAGYRALKA